MGLIESKEYIIIKQEDKIDVILHYFIRWMQRVKIKHSYYKGVNSYIVKVRKDDVVLCKEKYDEIARIIRRKETTLY